VKLLLSVDSKDPGDDPGDDNDNNNDSNNDSNNNDSNSDNNNVVQMKRPAAPPADEEVDLDDLVDAPSEETVSPEQRLANAFPGSQIIDE